MGAPKPAHNKRKQCWRPHVRAPATAGRGDNPTPSPGRGPGELGGWRARRRCGLTEAGRASCKPPRLSPSPGSLLGSTRRAAPGRGKSLRARPCRIPGPGSRTALRASPSRLGRRAPSPASRATGGTVTSLGEAGAFTAFLLTPSREAAGGEAGARAWWLRGLRGRLPPRTGGNRCLQREHPPREPRRSDCSQSNTHLLRRALALPTGFQVVRRHRGSQERQNSSLPEHPQQYNVGARFSLAHPGRESWETRGEPGNG